MADGKKRKGKPSQGFVPIEQIRDGIVVLKDGSVRSVLMASSINIALKGSDEQMAILGQFENFLNSLDFSIQIFIQSRELDIRPYIALLNDQLKNQTSELMKIQIREYMDFVNSFVENSSIMTKGFYIIIPYNPPSVEINSGSKGFTALFNANTNSGKEVSLQLFEEYRSQIEQRVSVVTQGLARTGIHVAQLGTEEVIELFYRLFNIGELDKPMSLSDLTSQET
jgi:hypothetical protein